MTWVILTFIAVIMQTFRNALQSKISEQGVPTAGVTLSRFLLAPPIAALYLGILYCWEPAELPSYNLTFWFYVLIASIMQIVATSLMVVLFKQKNFAVGAGLAKSEALVAGVLGTLFFGSQLSLLGWVGIVIGAIAVFVLSGIREKGTLNIKTVLIGLACGASFALTSLYVREAAHALDLPFPFNSAWVLFYVLCIQTLLLSVYIWVTTPNTFRALASVKGMVVSTSCCSCLGSIAWFSAMTLQYVAYVKTLGQVEVLFTILIAVWWLKHPIKRDEVIGLVLIAIAAVFVMWQ